MVIAELIVFAIVAALTWLGVDAAVTGALAKGGELGAVPDTAVHQRRPQVGKATVVTEGRLDLGCQLARGLQDQTPERPVLCQVGQDRQRKSGRLARPGLGSSDQVFPSKNYRKRAVLDRRGIGEPHGLSSADDLRGEAKIFK